jgi:predicted phosphodiesterase
MKFAAASDLHGQCRSLHDLLERAVNLGAEFLVLGGDLTNAEYAGYSTGMEQIAMISSIIESSGMETIYVLGNRDQAGGRCVECDLHGDLAKKDVEVDGYTFTNRPDGIGERSIYLNHQLGPVFRSRRSGALLVLYGHDHVPRLYQNYIGLGYLNNPDGAGGPRGGFFMIEVDDGKTGVEYVNMGGMIESCCSEHADQGTFYVPYSWGSTCPMCRNDEKYRFHF